jgi:hypothetical protein
MKIQSVAVLPPRELEPARMPWSDGVRVAGIRYAEALSPPPPPNDCYLNSELIINELRLSKNTPGTK